MGLNVPDTDGTADRPTPEVQILLDLFTRHEAPPPIHELTVREGRSLVCRAAAALQRQAPEMESVVDRLVPTAEGSVPVRVYIPRATSAMSVLAYIHGGGWVTGDLDVADRPCRQLAEHIGCIVVSIDYRLSPEHRYPAALDDCDRVITWLREQRGALGGRSDFLGLVGDSAGGNLAAALAMRGRDRGAPPVDALALLYPVLAPAHSSPYASYRINAANPVLAPETMAWFWSQYVRSEHDYLDPYVCPAVAANLAGMPPTLVVTAGLDILRDEGRAFAGRLAAAGVPTELVEYAGVTHGFLSMDKLVPQAAEVLTVIDSFMRARTPA